MTASLAALSARDRDAVLNAVIAVEESVDPVPHAQYPALADPALRDLVARSLHGAGRTLIRVDDTAWISGYDDTIADRLAEEGTGVLAPVDAAVLTLVLLHAVAIPAARERQPAPTGRATTSPRPTSTRSRPTVTAVSTSAPSALRSAGSAMPASCRSAIGRSCCPAPSSGGSPSTAPA